MRLCPFKIQFKVPYSFVVVFSVQLFLELSFGANQCTEFCFLSSSVLPQHIRSVRAFSLYSLTISVMNILCRSFSRIIIALFLARVGSWTSFTSAMRQTEPCAETHMIRVNSRWTKYNEWVLLPPLLMPLSFTIFVWWTIVLLLLLLLILKDIPKYTGHSARPNFYGILKYYQSGFVRIGGTGEGVEHRSNYTPSTS